MKYHLIQSVMLAVAFVLFSSSNGSALLFSEIDTYEDGASTFDSIKIFKDSDTLGSTNGGEFKINVVGKGDESYDFISFCLERTEYVWLPLENSTYRVDSISDDAVGGGTERDNDSLVSAGGSDPISDETKWWFWTYLNNGFGRSGEIADYLQNIIWYLEGEILNLSGNAFTFYNNNRIASEDFSINGNVKVLNISRNGTPAQSQLIAEPVPEPTTMLLLGAGLAGLAGRAVRRRAARV